MMAKTPRTAPNAAGTAILLELVGAGDVVGTETKVEISVGPMKSVPLVVPLKLTEAFTLI